MKNLFLTLTFVAVACVSAQAASLSAVKSEVGDNDVYVISLTDLTAADQATALSIAIMPNTGVEFLNFDTDGVDGGAIPAGVDKTFTNALLGLPVAFGGRGWTIIDGSPEVPPPSGPNGIGYAASTPGAFMTADNLFLNNVTLPRGGAGLALVTIIGGDGNPLPGGNLSAVLGIPEPGTMAMAGLSLIGLAFRRRLG